MLYQTFVLSVLDSSETWTMKDSTKQCNTVLLKYGWLILL